MRRRDLFKAIPLLMTPALARAETLPLRFIPNANLTSLDPIWTTALVAQSHGYLVYDTLYGIDASNKLQPQMCAGHEVSADDLTWTFTLRDGLAFHDGEKVLAKDCVMSLKRWASRDSFGQQLTRVANEIVALEEIAGSGASFLVAVRIDATGRIRALSDIAVPRRYADLFVEIPEQRFRFDTSSSEIRARRDMTRPA